MFLNQNTTIKMIIIGVSLFILSGCTESPQESEKPLHIQKYETLKDDARYEQYRI